MTEQIQRLPVEFGKNGNQYRLRKRGKVSMIYASIGPDDQELDYEVFKIKVRPANERFGKQYPATETFPSSESFGQWAWWCNTEEKALSYFHGLERGEKVGYMGSREANHEGEQS